MPIHDIFAELYRLVGEELFAPIAFQHALEYSYFFVHSQGEALKKLFEQNLIMNVNGKNVNLMVKFGVSKFQIGHLDIKEKLISYLTNSARASMGLKFLNLCALSTNQELADIKIWLNNEGFFKLFCSTINEMDMIKEKFSGFNLSNNSIKTLKPLKEINGFKMKYLDLSCNQIVSFDEFLALRDFDVKELIIAGNPVVKMANYHDKITKFLPDLEKIDGIKMMHHCAPQQKVLRATFSNGNGRIRNVAQGTVMSSRDINDNLKEQFNSTDSTSFNDYWHQVIVSHNGKFTRDVIMREMLSQLFNYVAFYPCFYSSQSAYDTFFLYHSREALNALVQNDLILRMPSSNHKITFELNMKCAAWQEGHIDWYNKINYVVNRRMQGSQVNLDSFASDCDFEFMMVPMSTLAGLEIIIDTVKYQNNKLLKISLSNNGITSMESLQSLTEFPNLSSLDLRKNAIRSFDGFPVLITIDELFLDENPICAKYYKQPSQYARDMVKVFPKLKWIDGRRIGDCNICVMQNFFISPNAFTFAEEFTNFFFKLYDSDKRAALNHIYRPKAVLTISYDCEGEFFCCIPEGVLRQLRKYDKYSRNILNSKDKKEIFFHGSKQIAACFEFLPLTEHDFTKMTIDVMEFNENRILVTINGAFKQNNTSELILGFTRTFQLERSSNDRRDSLPGARNYRILNDMLLIKGASQLLRQNVFNAKIVDEHDTKELCKDLLPFQKEKKEMIILLKDMTQLKRDICIR